jgi:hypothetical protein
MKYKVGDIVKVVGECRDSNSCNFCFFLGLEATIWKIDDNKYVIYGETKDATENGYTYCSGFDDSNVVLVKSKEKKVFGIVKFLKKYEKGT